MITVRCTINTGSYMVNRAILHVLASTASIIITETRDVGPSGSVFALVWSCCATSKMWRLGMLFSPQRSHQIASNFAEVIFTMVPSGVQNLKEIECQEIL